MIIMQNSQENSSSSGFTLQKQPRNGIFQLFYLLNYKHPLRKQIHIVLILSNYFILLLNYLSLSQINMVSTFWAVNSQIGILCMFASLSVIIIQCIVGVLYGKQMFLKLQILVYRNIIFIIAFGSIINTNDQSINSYIVISVAFVCAILLFIIQFFMAKQHFSKYLINETGPPISTYLLVFQSCLCLHGTSNESLKIVTVYTMFIVSVLTKFGIIDCGIRRSKCLEYTLFKIHASTNLIYSSFLIFNQILDIDGESYAFIFPLIVFVILAQFFSQKTDQMKPIPQSFFNIIQNPNMFLECCQYVMDDLHSLQSDESVSISETCLIPIYFQHVKNCQKLDCNISHQISSQILSSNGKYKNMSTIVAKIFEQLFENYTTIFNENLHLKFAYLRFCSKIGVKKFKIIQIITDIEKHQLSFVQKKKVYVMKRYVSDIDIIEFIETLKYEDSFQSFNQLMSSLMRLLIQFWTQLLEQRVDFQKLFKIKQKIISTLSQIETQMEQSLILQTFSTVRIMKTYSQFCRQIVNDDMKSSMISDYVKLLNKKMSQVHQINCISADMQIGLVAISLNVKKLGQIKMASNQAAIIFNYPKEQFVKLNVNSIMPSLFAKYHDEFLKVFLVNQHKKVNTDRRLVIGKKKQGYIFEIYLQLQKSIMTTSDELIFIANIQVAKTQQANVLVVCDDKGNITDSNSTYREIFQKPKKNKHNSHNDFSNVQEIIPNFVELVSNKIQSQTKYHLECYDNPVFGIMEIKYQIMKLSFRQAPNAGYFVKGWRMKQQKPKLFKNNSISEILVQLAEQKDLKGIQVQYCSQNNQYLFNDAIDTFGCDLSSQFTIPYAKLQFFSKILQNDYRNMRPPQYDADIKTLRFCRDHFQRVEEPQAFESEISEEEKATISNSKFGIMKQKLKSQDNLLTSQIPKIVTLSFAFVFILTLSIFYVKISTEKEEYFNAIEELIEADKFRSQLSQYVLYFQAESDALYTSFFKQKKLKLKNHLVEQISIANLPQQQKQLALKVVYLEQTLQNTTFEALITDKTFTLDEVELQTDQRAFLFFKILLGIFIVIKILINFAITQWHKKKLTNIFSLFLSVSEVEVKACHRKCVEFLKKNNNNFNQTQQKIVTYQQQIEQNEQQNPHIKIKKFKNIFVGSSSSSFLFLNIFILLFLLVFSAMLINDWARNNKLQIKQQTYKFISSVMPEYSVALMKIYSEKKQNITISIDDTFTQKYQSIDYKLANIKAKQTKQTNTFLELMFQNSCQTFTFDIPSSTSCQNITEGVMTDGISKSVNFLSTRMHDLQSESTSDSIIQEFDELAILLYHLVQPVILNIQSQQQQQINYQNDYIRIQVLLYFILLLLVCVCDTIYQWHYPLKQITQNIANSKSLIKFIPEPQIKPTKDGYMSLS